MFKHYVNTAMFWTRYNRPYRPNFFTRAT